MYTSTNEILHGAVYGIAIHTWPVQIILQNFDPLTNMIDDIVAFCKWLEQVDTVQDGTSGNKIINLVINLIILTKTVKHA